MTTTAPAGTIRVSVPDVWEVVDIPLNPDRTIEDLKTEALQRTLGRTPRADPAKYIVKYRGALVSDERITVGALHLSDRASLIVLPARRRPVT